MWPFAPYSIFPCIEQWGPVKRWGFCGHLAQNWAISSLLPVVRISNPQEAKGYVAILHPVMPFHSSPPPRSPLGCPEKAGFCSHLTRCGPFLILSVTWAMGTSKRAHIFVAILLIFGLLQFLTPRALGTPKKVGILSPSCQL